MGDERSNQADPGTDTETAASQLQARPSGQAAEPGPDAGLSGEPTHSGAGGQGPSGAHNPAKPGASPGPATTRVGDVLTPERFSLIFRRVPASLVATNRADVVVACERYGIVQPEHLAAALAQWGHETGEGRYLAELWGPTPQQIKYDPPHPLAKRLGNMLQGDGYKYRGRGLCMLTGLDNYRAAQREFREPLVDDPDRVGRWPLAALVGAWFFREHNLLGLDFEAQTKRLNGGLTGLPDRLEKWAHARRVLGLP